MAYPDQTSRAQERIIRMIKLRHGFIRATPALRRCDRTVHGRLSGMSSLVDNYRRMVKSAK